MNHFLSRSTANNEMFRYIEGFYNSIRPHSGIGWLSPNVFESSFFLNHYALSKTAA
ncbi:MAG: hypothetical protein FWC10_09520 [Lentimicrobiaceae bacterium]|nr:hypothetical protein [Lentimicrobiaceae bacterium]